MTRHHLAFCRSVGLLLGLLLAGDAGWAPRHARAYAEQASLDVSAGYLGVISSSTFLTNGIPLEIGAGMGISDLFVLRAGVGYEPRFAHGNVQQVGRLRTEIAYLVDVLRWVPFFGVGASLFGYDDGTAFRVRPAWHLLLGLDFLANRQWVFGLDVRPGLLWQRSGATSINEAQLRVSRMFELF
jgi:hypothetical protein